MDPGSFEPKLDRAGRTLPGIRRSYASSGSPRGLGISPHWKSVEGFLLIATSMDEATKVKIAVGIYALHRAVQHLRHTEVSKGFNL